MLIDDKDLDGLILRVQEAIEYDLALSAEDMKMILEVLLLIPEMSEKVTENDVTLYKLKKLAGMLRTSEKLRRERPKTQENKEAKPKKEKVTEHKVCNHAIEGLSKGDICPECKKGKLYKYEPAITVRVSGNSPLESTKHIRERLRCNACGAYFTAKLSEEVVNDGGEDNLYGYSARSIMAIYRYFGGMPIHRQESINHLLGVSVNASTILNQVEYVADALNPIFNFLKKLSSEAFSYRLDDTTNRILDVKTEMIPDRRTGKPKERKGIYTSGIIAENQEHKIVLFKTNIGHAGEFIDEILKNRPINAPPPLIMCDALSSNKPTVIENYHLTLCNAHARRNFFDLEIMYPKDIDWILNKYSEIWRNDKDFENSEKRLAYHKEYSLPVMLEIKSFCENHKAEPNSSMGKALKYFLNNFEGLTVFCKIPDALIDNNEMESMIKLIIRGRKNSLFFKTQHGADIADVLTSVIATCQKNDVNSFDYLINIQRFYEHVRKSPQDWLPWNYKKALETINKKTTHTSVS